MSLRSQWYCVLSFAIAGPLIGLTFWLAAGFVPPPSPSLSAEAIASLYKDNQTGIRVAVITSVLLWTCWLPLAAAISARMAAMETGFPMWSLLQFGGAVGMMLIVEFGALFWGIASYRADRSPELVRTLNDIGWFIFMMPVGPLAVQIAATGMVAFGTHPSKSTFPRWFGFFSLWVATATVPGVLLVFFQTGPFAWNGLFPFWVPVFAWGSWVVAVVGLMLMAIQREARSAVAVAMPAAPAG